MLFTVKLPFALEFISTSCCTCFSEPLCANIAWAVKQLHWSSLNANGRQRLVSVTYEKNLLPTTLTSCAFSHVTCKMEWIDHVMQSCTLWVTTSRNNLRAKKV